MVSVNDLLINDVTTDIRREKDAWVILVTIYLEMTQIKNEEPTAINCHVESILHISQNVLVGNTSEVVLDTSKKYTSINISLTVPAVSFSPLSIINRFRGFYILSTI